MPAQVADVHRFVSFAVGQRRNWRGRQPTLCGTHAVADRRAGRTQWPTVVRDACRSPIRSRNGAAGPLDAHVAVAAMADHQWATALV